MPLSVSDTEFPCHQHSLKIKMSETLPKIILYTYSLFCLDCHLLYKHTTQELYICEPQTQLASLLFQNLTTCFGPYGPSSGDIFEDSHSTATIHHLYKCEAIYCFLICMYTMLRKFKIHNFLHRIQKMHIHFFT
jgi:hypothetical protein